jgi:hypothetical protein
MYYLLGYILTLAAGSVGLHYTGPKLPGMFIVFLSTTYALVFFNVISIRTLRSFYGRAWQHKSLFLALNVTVLIMWLGAFLIPIYFQSSIYLTSFMSITATLGTLSICQKTRDLANILKSIILVINLFLFYIASSRYFHNLNLVALIVCTLVTGIAGYCYIRVSAECNRKGFGASEVLAIRFWLLWLIALGFVLRDNQFVYVSPSAIYKTISIATATIIVPIYLSQKAIQKLGADQSSILIGFTPFVAFLLERTVFPEETGYTGVFAAALATTLSVFYFTDLLRARARLNQFTQVEK